MTITTGAQQIPRGWELKSLLQVCEKITDGTHKTPVYQETGIPFISTANLVPFRKFSFGTYKRFISRKEHSFLVKRCKPEKGDLLISKIGTLGLTKCVDVDYGFSIFVGVALAKLRRDQIDGEFLEQSLNTPRMQQTMISLSPGSTRATLTIGAIEKMEIIFPHSLTEQRKIAEILSTTDEAIEKTEQRIEKLKHIKQGLMQDLFHYGIDENGHIRSEATHHFKDSPLGQIPEEWDDKKFKDVCKVRQGLQIAISQRAREGGENRYQYITVQYLNDPESFNVYVENPPKSVICREDDILLTRTGNTGMVITDIEGAFHNNFFLIDYDRSKVSKDWLVLYLNRDEIQNQFMINAGITTIPDLKHGDFYNTPCIYPKTLDEQSRIASILFSANKAIVVEEAYRRKLIAIKRGLMEDLLSGKVRVTHLINQN